MPKVPLNVRVDPALIELLKAQAKLENRTLSNMVVTALKRYLERGSLRSKDGGADNP
ncbi:MAG: CopG family transcriptional regulator [Thiocapsa sp.]|uniref:YlcI/YnfO family protein n=1 Tax=Thiocapsa sp. TaxID=2024551 RepID=UPI001BCEE773|nr:YlcI/YnfO family protein [Thiocapsa sp.]QVL47617.1 MAG: CopG family transcriptional regulator [Thiocapsa sp.]